MLPILGLHFCFLFIAPKAVLYASQVIKLFSCWSTLQAERLKNINHCDVPDYSLCWKEISFSDKLNEFS